MKNTKVIFSLFVVFLCLDSYAQDLSALDNSSLGLSLTTFNQDINNSETPYFVSFQNELPYLIGLTGLFSVGLVLQQTNKEDPFTIDELNNLDRNTINSFDRGATLNSSKKARSASDILFNLSMGLPTVVFLLNKHTRSDVLPLFVMGAESFLISGGLNLVAKHVFNRARPYTYNPDFSLETRTNGSSRLSFFSGHTSQASAATFFIAKVISDYHPDMNLGLKIGMWSTAVMIPAVTGYLRVESGRHYNTDVIAGFAIGAIAGWIVPHLNKKKKESQFSLKPYSISGANGLSLVLNLNK